ncbi:MAG TPA: MFS transporter [Symbiobacteriaceae bacterium]|nr:MFS transporter [Symbiobacteriaceae bacterium]
MAAIAQLRTRLTSFVGLTRPFTVFLAGLTASKLGDSLYTFALPWIAYELTHSAVVMGTLYATEIVPILLFGALAGVYVDRWDRRTLMMAADVLRAVLVALVPILHLTGLLAVWHLYVVAFLLSLVSLMFDVSTTAVIPEIAGGDLTRANAAHQMAMQVASMAGPALAGLVLAAVGGFNTLWLDALSFGGTFIALLGMPAFRRPPSGASAAGVLRGMVDGLKWLWQSPVIRVLSLQAMTGNFGFGMVSAVLMFYLRQTLGLSAQLSGLDYAMLGVGGVAGSIAVVPLVKRYRRGELYPAILLFGMAGLLLMAAVRTWWSPGLGFGMVSACNVAWVVLSTSVRQEMIPADLMGRVLSFSRVLSTAAMPVGATLGGLMTNTFDPAVVFLVAAGTKGLEVLIARYSAMRAL